MIKKKPLQQPKCKVLVIFSPAKFPPVLDSKSQTLLVIYIDLTTNLKPGIQKILIKMPLKQINAQINFKYHSLKWCVT